MTDAEYVYRSALEKILSLPPTQTGLGLEEAQKLAANGIRVGDEVQR